VRAAQAISARPIAGTSEVLRDRVDDVDVEADDLLVLVLEGERRLGCARRDEEFARLGEQRRRRSGEQQAENEGTTLCRANFARPC
jgi:hypothetical protein